MSGLDRERDELRKDLRERLRKDYESGRRPRTMAEVAESYDDSFKELKDAFVRQEELLQGLLHESKKQTKLLEEMRDAFSKDKKTNESTKEGEKHEQQ